MQANQDKRYEFVGSIVDAETGEIAPAVVKKTQVKGPLQFALIDRRVLFDMFLRLDGCTKDVLSVIFRDMKDYTNIFKGTYKDLEEKTKASPASVSRAMKDLQERDVIRMIRNGEWAVNPIYCWTTDSDKQRGQIYWYNTLEPKDGRSMRNRKKKGSDENVLRSDAESMEDGAGTENGAGIHS